MTPTKKQVPRCARDDKLLLAFEKKKKEASAVVIPSAVGARDLLLLEHL
jgi:hypothetical protein